MDELEKLSKIEQLLLMAAAVRGMGPTSDISHANTARLVVLALDWVGLWNDELREKWKSVEWDPAIDTVFEPLVRMTQQFTRTGSPRPPERPGEPLFEGNGNWGVPRERPAAHPLFNSCRLTAAGERLAIQLLEMYPQYRDPSDGNAPK